ncbi:penicillin-binding protein PBP1A [Streptococcus merionis]|uniref:penicillin-binding protein PBP1A n=1 Tax=Streptococcus merionis TaxID=400065 RepID=UPI0026E96E91|nr:penicillin-binding protein PBP1A [Streptococcus merionis]
MKKPNFNFSAFLQKSKKLTDTSNPLKRHLIILANLLLGLFVALFIAGASFFFYYAVTAPELTEESLTATSSSLIYDADNNLIADLGSEKRTNATTEEIPIDLANAIVAIEDHRFYDHRGVDVVRILGAVWNNLTSSSTQGGSTLTQQFIKLSFFSTTKEHQTIARKAQEAWLALQLERRNTKEEILTYYVNKVYMANGNYGMQTAANAYYGKNLNTLSLAQLALLAGMPQAPNQYDPYAAPEAAKYRRDLVLSQMLRHNYIDQASYDAAVATPIEDGLLPLKPTSSYPKYMDNYIKEVIEEVQEKTGYNLMDAGLHVYTNVNSDAQQRLWDIYHSDTYVNYPDNELQVASTVIDVTNGKVIAQLGSRHQTEAASLGVNQAVETNRDWGSTMKPITDYAPAIEYGIYNATSDIINDAPYYYPGTSTPVNNWDRSYFGYITIQDAIMYSRNVPAVKSLEAVGLKNSLTFLNKLGINYPEMFYSNAISSATSVSDIKYGASSEKMAAAYAAFSNGGTYYKPQYVNRVVFRDETEMTFEPEGSQAMKATTAYMMTNMMKTVFNYGAGNNAVIRGLYQAGKTGTSNYTDDEMAELAQNYPIYSSSIVAPDESFVGYNSQYAMAVWTGYKNRMVPILDSSLYVATDVYRNMMLYLYETTGSGTKDWTIPDGLYRYGNHVYLNGARITYSSSSTSTSSEEESTEDTSSSTDSSTQASSSDTNTSASPSEGE